MRILGSLLLFTFVTVAHAQQLNPRRKASTNQPTGRPNILWITCEDMSANLPSYGDRTVPTPTIDRLVREGVRYTRMFSTAGVCAPSRSAIISGMYPVSIGTNHMRTNTTSLKRPDVPNYDAVPPPNVKCFTEYLRANGYYCTNNSKTDYQFGNPITAWDENGPKAHWRNRPRRGDGANQPFFAVFNLFVTHESQIWARADQPLRVNPANVTVPPYYPDTPVIRRDLARYYDNIMVMDSLAGGILRQLEDDGLLNNTIVVFFSDHGAGLPWFKRELYDRGLHVPFVIRYPDGRQSGTTDTELHSFVDLAPTMLSLTGTPIPAHLQGQAFIGPQRANDSLLRQARLYVFGARDRMDEHYDRVRVVRDKRYKYVRNYEPEKPHYQDIAYRRQMPLMQDILRLRDAGQLTGLPARWFQHKAPEELYDTETDPNELENLIDKPTYTAQRNRLRKALDDHLTRVGDTGAEPERDMVRRMYGGDTQPQTAPPVVSARANNVTLTCPTAGASVAYQLDGEERWRLATGPVALPTGRTLRAKAIRYGYRESDVTNWPGRK